MGPKTLNRAIRNLAACPFLVVACAVFSEAALLRNILVKVTQPDGAVLDCLASGDEFYNWLHDKDGYTIIRNSANGYYVYAKKVGGDLLPTMFIAGQATSSQLELAGIIKHLLHDPKSAKIPKIKPQSGSVVNAPPTGTINNLVVFIRFAGEAEFTQTAVDTFKNMFNAGAASANSLKNYFAEASYGQLAIESTFYPNSVPAVFSYLDAYGRSYYQPYDETSNPDGYQNESARTLREHTLLKNAVDSMSSEVPAGLDVDADADGTVDNVCFIVTGGPTAWSTLLWPHKWDLYSFYVAINGKRVWTYNFQLETTMEVGILCHEMFHSIGAPDLYHDLNGSYANLEPVWAWDLMEWNLEPPEHMGAYMKYKYGQWIPFLPEITTSGTYTLSPLTSATGNCYKIRSPASSTQYFIVEYRKKVGTFEGNLYNEGLLVYRINTAAHGNFSGPPDEVYIYRPDGTLSQNGSPWYAPFSADQERTEINDGTNPSCFLAGGTPGALSISNVGHMGSTISFEVTIHTIMVTSPNGGDVWSAGSAATVTWMSTGTMASVDVELSTNGGSSWTTLADNTANDGTEEITVPAVSSSNCLIRVAEGTGGHPSDVSDAAFSIVMIPSSLTVTSPNGGETWAAGSTHDVTWTQTGLTGSVTIDLYKGGINQETLGTAAATAGTFSWAINPGQAIGTDYRVSIKQGAVSDESDADFTIGAAAEIKVDFLATWDGYGVYYRNSETGSWVRIEPTPAAQVTAGDLDGDGTDDLMGIWPGDPGVWVKFSTTHSWAMLDSIKPEWIGVGDMNGDGRKDLVCTWTGYGVYYRNSMTGSWVRIEPTPASQVTAGDLDGDGTDDLMGIWPGDPGVWVKFSTTRSWAMLDSIKPEWIAAGDMNGDGREDLVATWAGYGVYYRNSKTGLWVRIEPTPATQITAGDLDGDSKAELIGIWAGDPGIWVKYSKTSSWAMLDPLKAKWIGTGKMRPEPGPSGLMGGEPGIVLEAKQAGREASYRTILGLERFEDLSSTGPGGRDFKPAVEKYAPGARVKDPRWQRQMKPGPGESGFRPLLEESRQGRGQSQISKIKK
jgi:M6 family metalloprotease-like protein